MWTSPIVGFNEVRGEPDSCPVVSNMVQDTPTLKS